MDIFFSEMLSFSLVFYTFILNNPKKSIIQKQSLRTEVRVSYCIRYLLDA